MKEKTVKVIHDNGPSAYVFFVAWVGALIYFINHAQGFWEVVLAILQSIVWPAIVLYRALELLGL